MDKFKKFVACGVLFLTLVLSIGAVAPKEIRLEKASYRKITISWQAPNATTQVANYKVFRDGTEIATTTALNYTDETVQPGIKYTYKILAVIVGAGDSDFSSELPVRTLKSATFENSQLVENVVDSFHETPRSNLNAVSLISAVKAGFEALLGSNISFSVIDESIVSSVIVEELNWINTVTPELTEAERLAVQAEIDSIMNSSFGGNSFDHMFINQKLTQLGDKHWKAGNKNAAELFYEFSLNYLSNHESTVSGSLSRLAYFAKSHLTQDSSCADISESLNKAKAYLDRFFDFFPNPATNSAHAKSALSQPVGWYFAYFPKMLEYSNYDALFFSTAHEAAKRLVAFDPSNKNAVQCLERVAAWELITLQMRFVDEKGNPRTGSVKVCNVSAENGKSNLFSGNAYVDERAFTLSNGVATIPVYTGHDYSISLDVDVANGNKLKFELPAFKYEKNKLVSYDYLTDSFTETSSSQSRADFVISSAAYPYNLRADRGIDVFDLSWDWAAPENFVTAGFKVYRGNTEVASVSKQTVRLPLNNVANEYTYKVIAVDANGYLSTASQSIAVYPGDQSQYSDFFDWMNSYFGDAAIYASDDPDNDGVDNYHEFLNGTDPTKVPGPMPYAGPRGFNELTLEWETISDTADATYQISRNGTVVGTSNTNKFTDTNLVPGVSYIYKVKLLTPAAVATDWGLPNTFSTQKAHNYEHADKVQKVVDQFQKLNILEYTGPTLLSAVKSSLETLTGSTITFTVINPELVEKMVDQELELLREVSPQLTTAERITARNELNKIMEESWGGNSFEEMFIQTKLAELAEKHWQEYLADKTKTSRKTAALELYEASLLFLTNHEPSVRKSLSRLALFEMQSLDANSTDTQIKNALISARDTMLRIYTYFPEPAELSSNPYRTIISNYRKFFPRLLAYDKYDQALFDNVLQLASVYRDQDVTDANRRNLYDDIFTWQLVQLTVTSGIHNGTITLENVTKNYPSMPWGTEEGNKDIRTFSLNGNSFVIPVYAGHLYNITIKVPVAGGADWIHSVSGIKFGSAVKTIDNPFSGITVEDMTDSNGRSEFVFPVNAVAFPYNLECEKYPDTFTLSWQYIPSNGTTVDHYNIYRGNSLVATSKTMSCAGIARQVFADGVYTYRVSAVDAAGFETERSPIIQVLPDFTEEEQKYFEWKQKYFGNAAVLATDDNDQDGLTNYQEFLLGSNPTISALSIDLSDITGKISGAKVSYYRATNTAMPDFSSMIPFKTEVRSDFCFNSTSGNILGSGKTEQVALVADGFFDVATDGYYSFIIKSNDGMKLLINGVEILNHNLIDSARERATTIYLKAGINSFQVQYFNYRNAAELQIKWGTKGGDMKNFASKPVWHLENIPAKLLEYIATRKDSDGDQLSDMDEMRYGTSHLNADSDGDGLSDYAEVKIHFTNPNNADTNGNGVPDAEEVKLNGNNVNLDNVFFELRNEINGADYVSSVGTWENINTMAHSKERRGSLTYNVIATDAGIYKLEFLLSSAYTTGNDNPFDIYIDGRYVASSLQQLTTATRSFSILTPYLQPGTHSVTIHWDNHRLTEDLLVKKLKLYCIGNSESAPANDGSVTEQTVAEKIVEKRNQVVSSISSRVSPFCLTGSSEFPGLTKVNAESAIVYAENKWMKNIDLNEVSSINAAVSFENGAITKTTAITWLATDIVAESGKALTIRKGDSLLLTANADSATSWTATSEGINLSGEAGKNQAYKFDAVGKYTISGNCLNAAGESIGTGTLTVNVVDYQFKRDNVICIVNYGREWNINAIPEAVNIKTDSRYKAVFVDTNTSSTPYLKIFVDDNKERYNYAVIDTDGKENIIAVQKIQGMEVFSSNFTGIRQVASTDDLIIGDDMKVYNMQIIASPVRPDIEFRVNIFVAGVTFADGTVNKSIKSSDFNSNGMCSVDFIRPNEASSSICHTMKAYQNNEYIGIRQK